MMQVQEATIDLRKLVAHPDLGAGAVTLLAALIEKSEQFSGTPVDVLAAKIKALKPPRRLAPRPVTASLESATAQVREVFTRLSELMADAKLAHDFIEALYKGNRLSKSEALDLGRLFGLSVTSKTSRIGVYQALKVEANQRARDRFQADRIRRGA